MRHIRIFLSSPGDVDHERRRVDRVVERLNGVIAGTALLEAIEWETEFYKAHATFQAQIPEAADCDIVIAIFRHRLGTELPDDFARMPDSRTYPSGSAYEVLSAIDAHRARGVPDVYVFRHPDPPTVRLDDPAAAQIQEQWQRLKAFFDEWFINARGQFKAAFQTFSTADEFESQVERLLRRWLDEKILRGRSVLWPIATKGSPFRGLASYGAKHASVFFGRSRDITRAVDQWKEAAERGAPFLLILGASGAGKSSLARAGLAPRLAVPGVVPSVDLWRTAVMRPSEVPGGPVITLATRLFDDETDIPEDERGRQPALPEIAQSDFTTPDELAHLFTHAEGAAHRPVLRALDRAGENERVRQHYDRPVRVDLILVVDQLDEIFAPDIAAEERAAFGRVLTDLTATGRIWILATLRADLYERFLAEPALLALKTRGAAYDLAPPGPTELAEILRRPAEAAGLVYETDPVTGERLDERLLQDADRPDMLPLLQLALNRLFDERTTEDGEPRLTIAAYQELGGLGGVIDREAEAAMEGLGEAETAELAGLLRRLAAVRADANTTSGSLTTRTAPLAEAARNAAAQRLIAALVEARILLTSGQGEDAGICLVHLRVLADWHRARELVDANVEFYRIRDEVEEQRRRWDGAGRRSDLLIPPGLPLAEAESNLTRFGDDLPAHTRAFIAASGRKARRHHRLTAFAALLFGILAIAATGTGLLAHREQQRAERTLGSAKDAVHVIVVNIASGLSHLAGVRVDAIEKLLEGIVTTVDRLSRDAPDDVELSRLELVMRDEFATTYMTAGDLARAQQSAQAALAEGHRLADRDPANPEWQQSISVALSKLGAINLKAGQAEAALKAYDAAAKIAERLSKQDAKNPQWRNDLSVSLNGIGDVKVQTGDGPGALAAYEQGLAIARELSQHDPDNLELRRDVAVRLDETGDVKRRLGDTVGATTDYEQALSTMQALSDRIPGNTQWQRDVIVSLTRIGDLKLQAGKTPAALEHYERALSITRHLAALDPSNPQTTWDVVGGLEKIGDVKRQTGDASAGDAYQEALDDMRRLVKIDPKNGSWQRDLAVCLNKMGDFELSQRDFSKTLAVYDESLGIVRALAEHDPGNAMWLRDVAVGLNKRGDLKLNTGDVNAALADYQEALATARRLSERDPSNTQWLRDVMVNLNKLGDGDMRAAKLDDAASNFAGALEIGRRLIKRDADNAQWQWDLGFTLIKLGDAQLRLSKPSEALASYKEALPIMHGLLKRDPGNAQRGTDLVACLYRMANVESGPNRDTALNEALNILQRLKANKQLSADQSGWPELIRQMQDPPPFY